MSALECQTCGAHLHVGSRHLTAWCAYCGSPSVIERPAHPNTPEPSFALAFVIPEHRAAERVKRAVGRAFLSPRAFREAAVREAPIGVYMPAYLYTAAAYTSYSADIGEDYTRHETHEEKDAHGNRIERTRTTHHTEWRSLSGRHAVYINDHVVTASHGLENRALEAIHPFDLRALKRFTPALISGWITEQPSLGRRQSLERARENARARIRSKLAHFMPGDRHRSLRHNTEFRQEHMELTLLPIWIVPVRYRHDRPAVKLVLNGQTGAMWAKMPVSVARVALLLFAIAAAFLVAYWLSSTLAS